MLIMCAKVRRKREMVRKAAYLGRKKGKNRTVREEGKTPPITGGNNHRPIKKT